MNLRIAGKNDKNQLYRLWQEAFGDAEKDIDLFFKSVIKADNTVVGETDGKIVSALYLIEAEIVRGDNSYPAYYVYAAATDKKFRRQGIMAKLLEYSSELARQRGVDYLFLHPETEKLYGYYAKNGFKTAFYNGCDNDGYVKWSEEIKELDRLLNDGEADTRDEHPGKTGMIKKINGTAPEIECAYLGITLE